MEANKNKSLAGRPSTLPEFSEFSAIEIAKAAGVSRASVYNWQRGGAAKVRSRIDAAIKDLKKQKKHKDR